MNLTRPAFSLGLGALLAAALLSGCAEPPRKSVIASDPASSGVPTRARPSPQVAPRRAETQSAGRSRQGGQITALLRTAQSFLGSPYRYGGKSASGFDCSGLVQRVFARYGVRLPRSCAAQARRGRPVERAQLAAGDLVFFGRANGAPTHVGIYEGGNRFIHASTGKRRVSRDSLSEQWFARHYRGARRIQLP